MLWGGAHQFSGRLSRFHTKQVSSRAALVALKTVFFPAQIRRFLIRTVWILGDSPHNLSGMHVIQTHPDQNCCSGVPPASARTRLCQLRQECVRCSPASIQLPRTAARSSHRIGSTFAWVYWTGGGRSLNCLIILAEFRAAADDWAMWWNLRSGAAPWRTVEKEEKALHASCQIEFSYVESSFLPRCHWEE